MTALLANRALHAEVLANAAHKVAESHKTDRERFPRHLAGISLRIDESWNYTLDEKYADTERRDPWMR